MSSELISQRKKDLEKTIKQTKDVIQTADAFLKDYNNSSLLYKLARYSDKEKVKAAREASLKALPDNEKESKEIDKLIQKK